MLSALNYVKYRFSSCPCKASNLPEELIVHTEAELVLFHTLKPLIRLGTWKTRL